jgi:hypothetical protein
MRQPGLLDLSARRRLLSDKATLNVGAFGRARKDRCGALRTNWSDLTMSVGTTRIHRNSWRRGSDMATGGACATASDAADRAAFRSTAWPRTTSSRGSTAVDAVVAHGAGRNRQEAALATHPACSKLSGHRFRAKRKRLSQSGRVATKVSYGKSLLMSIWRRGRNDEPREGIP